MAERGEPVGDTVSSDSELEDQAVGSGGGQGDPASTSVGDAPTGTAAAYGWLRSRRVLLGIGVSTAALVVVGAGAVGSGVGDDASAPPEDAASSTSVSTTTTAETTTTTFPSTTSTTTWTSTTTTTVVPTSAPPDEPVGEPTADNGVMAPINAPSTEVSVCSLGPWGGSHPQGSIPGPPEQAQLVNGPNWNCANGNTGCNVTISTTWSDGVTASDSRVLPTPGMYTLNDGRGTTASFSVSSDLYCAFGSADYGTVWLPGT